MSRSNAAAIRRRVGNVASTPSVATSKSLPVPPAPEQSTKLTLQEVISLFDKRINALEESRKLSEGSVSRGTLGVIEDGTAISNVLDEFNHRFEMLANEISDLKETVLKLQTYTMDVNKMLLGERVQVLSELGTNITMRGTEDVDMNSVYSLNSDANLPNDTKNVPGSPTSVDMRKEVTENTE